MGQVLVVVHGAVCVGGGVGQYLGIHSAYLHTH